eukprot:6467012-Amphidinium_carterae.2
MLHELLARTAVQRIYEVVQWMERRKKGQGEMAATAESLEASWTQNVEAAASSEKVTAGFIKTAVNIWNNLLKKDTLRDVIVSAEQRLGKNTPFSKTSVLEAVTSKCAVSAPGSDHLTEWTLSLLVHYIDKKLCMPGELTVRYLTGKDAGGRGLLDTIIVKKSLVEYIQTTLVSELSVSAPSKDLSP